MLINKKTLFLVMTNNGTNSAQVADVLTSQSMGVYQLNQQIKGKDLNGHTAAYVLIDPVRNEAYYLEVSSKGVQAAYAKRVLRDKWVPDTRPIGSLDELKQELGELGLDVPSVRKFAFH